MRLKSSNYGFLLDLCQLLFIFIIVTTGVLGLETAKEWFQRCSGDPDEIRKEVKILYEYYQSASGTSNETGFYFGADF